MTDGNRRAILAALLANLGISIAKFLAFLATGAASMLAESVHSVADTGNQLLLILGGVRAQREPTPEHPFGYGRERYFWAFVVAMVLFSLGSLFAISQGIDKLRHPHSLTSPGWAVGVLLVGMLLEGGSLRIAVREAGRLRAGESWWDFVRHAKSPELPVVLLEDLGALIGLLIALCGVSLAFALDDPRFDAGGSIAIGVLLGAIAVVLAIEMKSLLIGESASPRIRRLILDAIEAAPQVRRLIHLRTLHLGPDELLVGAKVELEPALDFRAVAEAIDAVEQSIRDRVPAARVIYIEPDIQHTPTG